MSKLLSKSVHMSSNCSPCLQHPNHIKYFQFNHEIIKHFFQEDLGNPSSLTGDVDLLWGWQACWWRSPGQGASGWCWPPLWDEPPWRWSHWLFLSRPGRLSSSWPHEHLDWDWLTYPAASSRSEEKKKKKKMDWEHLSGRLNFYIFAWQLYKPADTSLNCAVIFETSRSTDRWLRCWIAEKIKALLLLKLQTTF